MLNEKTKVHAQVNICGDGTINGSEVCDDGNARRGDGCSATCTVETGFTCNTASPTVCTEDCGDGKNFRTGGTT